MSKLRINDLESLDTGASVAVDAMANAQTGLARRVIFVDTIAALQALPTSELVDGQQVQVKEYHAGTGVGGGEFYWDASSDKAAHDGGVVIDPAHTESTGTEAFLSPQNTGDGCWMRSHFGEYCPEWWGIDSDVGLVINHILSRYGSAAIKLSNGTYPCQTTINVDIAGKLEPVKIFGTHSGGRGGAFPEPIPGSVIDGSLMSDTVIQCGFTSSKLNFSLVDIAILAGSSDGVICGYNGIGSAGSKIENVTVHGGTRGFVLGDMYGGWVNQIYAVRQSVTGASFYRMNASKVGMVTVRGCTGDWALEIEDGKGCELGNLYLESNSKSALNISGNIRGSSISSLFLENNNIDGVQQYEVIIGDSNKNPDPVESIVINSMNINYPGTPLGSHIILVDNASSISFFGFKNRNANFLKLSGIVQSSILFSGGDISNGEIDLSLASVRSAATFTNCQIINFDSISIPLNDFGIDFSGCSGNFSKSSQRIFTTSGDIKLNETCIRADPSGGNISLTLPYGYMSGDKTYTILNVSTSGNTVSLSSPAGITPSNPTLADGESVTLRFISEAWRVIS